MRCVGKSKEKSSGIGLVEGILRSWKEVERGWKGPSGVGGKKAKGSCGYVLGLEVARIRLPSSKSQIIRPYSSVPILASQISLLPLQSQSAGLG